MQTQQQQMQQMASTMQKQQNQQQQQQSQPNNIQQNTQEMEKLKKDLLATNVEKERFQAQLEMLVQELEKSQVCNRYFLPRLRLKPVLILIFKF